MYAAPLAFVIATATATRTTANSISIVCLDYAVVLSKKANRMEPGLQQQKQKSEKALKQREAATEAEAKAAQGVLIRIHTTAAAENEFHYARRRQVARSQLC